MPVTVRFLVLSVALAAASCLEYEEELLLERDADAPDGPADGGDGGEPDGEPIPSEHSPALVAAGRGHTCAVTSAGGVRCWGMNDQGQLGAGEGWSEEWSAVAVDVAGLPAAALQVAAGEFHTCALLADGSTWCWGSNVESQAGTGVPDNDPHPVPAAVPGLGDRVVDLASGAEHLCALLAGGPVLCWGYDYYSQCAVPPDPVLPYVTVPTAVAGIGGDVAAVAAGNNHGCVVLASGGVRCWGANETAQGGARDPGLPATAPADVPGLDERVVDLAAGRGHTCALTVSGRVRCWGANECGQVGNGSFSACMTYGDTPVYDPSEVDGLGPGVRAIAAGEDFTCAITADGRVRCWGANYYGQVGDATGGEGAPESVPLPVDVVGIEGAVGVEGGLWHACAVLDDGSARCWGADDWGQLGDGGEIGVGRYSNVPVEVLGFGD